MAQLGQARGANGLLDTAPPPPSFHAVVWLRWDRTTVSRVSD